jgi:hypothetical protein
MNKLTFVILSAVLLLVMPIPAFSQYLEQRDISIFIKNKRNFEEFVIKYVSFNEEEEMIFADDDWKNYIETISEVLPYDSAKSFMRQFQNILDCKVPYELEAFFKDIGWSKNGAKKFYTIGVIFAVIAYIERNAILNEQNYALVDIISNSFNMSDVEIIKENYQTLKMLFMGTN